jgi:hypothetical protein
MPKCRSASDIEAAHPEQRLNLNGHIAERLRELGCTLELSQFFRLLVDLFRVGISLRKKSPMNDLAASQGQIGLDCVQFLVS